MAQILLTEYAKRHSRNPVVAAQKAARGTFQTAKKLGRYWWIDENEPYSDTRVKSGAYIGFSARYRKSGRKNVL